MSRTGRPRWFAAALAGRQLPPAQPGPVRQADPWPASVRRLVYLRQTGAHEFTPRQRRRWIKKHRRADR